MQSLAIFLSVLLLFDSNSIAHPAVSVLSNSENNTLENSDDVYCYNSGYGVSRALIVEKIDWFCDNVGVDWLRMNRAVTETFWTEDRHRIITSVEPKDCNAIDQDLKCKTTLREPVDRCNTMSTEGKQGGTIETRCARWRVDPQWDPQVEQHRLEKRDSVHCYNSGFDVERKWLIEAIDGFCDWVGVEGLRKNEGRELTYRYRAAHRLIVSVQPKGCDAVDQDLWCKTILRRPVDECDTSSTFGKQGGTVETDCATWRVDPQYWPVDPST